MRLEFLKKRGVRKSFKILHALVMFVLVFNMSYLGTFVGAAAVKADVGSIAVTGVDDLGSGNFKIYGTWVPQGGQCWTPAGGGTFHYYITVTDNGAPINPDPMVNPAACNGDFSGDVSKADRDLGGTWPASGQGSATFSLSPGSHTVCAVLKHVSQNGGDTVSTDCFDKTIIVPQPCTDTDNDGICDDKDNCKLVSNPLQQNSDGDAYGDACDNCAVTANDDQADTDKDGIGDSCDNCAAIANASQTDSDRDGTGDACDACANDANKTTAGVCGCGTPDIDSDKDGAMDCQDNCATDPYKTEAGKCGCGYSELDTDKDNTPDCQDACIDDPDKTAVGVCGCGVADTDTDGDGTPDCNDNCASDSNKTTAGVCGCGTPDIDSDKDGIMDCNDQCDNTVDTDGDKTPDCEDSCVSDPNKTAAGVCGCGVADVDTDNDGIMDCKDGCVSDSNKTSAGVCGCGVADSDTDGDGVLDCNDNCVNIANANQADADKDGKGDLCDNDQEACTQTISGTKWLVNSDYKLGGWIINLYKNNAVIATATTDSLGHYEFDKLCAGDYRLKEVMQRGWKQTSPYNVQEGKDYYDITLAAVLPMAETSPYVRTYDFTNEPGICGYKYNWSNEHKIPGWEIYLKASSSNALTLVDTATTDENGEYCFFPNAGSYEVSEKLVDGWTVHGPAAQTLDFARTEPVFIDFWNQQVSTQPVCKAGAVALVNPSFEYPATGSWGIFSGSETGWTQTDGLELQSTVYSAPSDGSQYAELDGNGSMMISQDVNSFAGAKYKLSYDFSPRPGVADNKLKVYVNGKQVDEMTADGSGNTTNVWTTGSYAFVADASSVTIAFADGSVSDSLGTFLDNVKLELLDCSPASQPVCGNKVIETGETCDDGNTVSGDGCSASCAIESTDSQSVCGNGIIEGNEVCDDGIKNGVPGNCNLFCTYRVDGGGSGGGGSRSDYGGGITYLSSTKTETPTVSSTTPDQPASGTDDDVIVLGEEGAAALKISKTADVKVTAPGEAIVYTVKVSNSGNLDAFNVVVKDNLPEGFSFADDKTTSKTWKIGTLKVGESKEIKYTANVSVSAAEKVYTNTAIASADNIPEVKATADVEISKVKVLAETGFRMIDLVAISFVSISALYVSRRMRRNFGN